MYITNTTNEFTTGSSHVVFLNIFFYGDVTQKRHWQENLPVGFNGLLKPEIDSAPQNLSEENDISNVIIGPLIEKLCFSYYRWWAF